MLQSYLISILSVTATMPGSETAPGQERKTIIIAVDNSRVRQEHKWSVFSNLQANNLQPSFKGNCFRSYAIRRSTSSRTIFRKVLLSIPCRTVDMMRMHWLYC